MSLKMDLKSDDIFNIDIDSALLLSYELDKLNLDSIPNDIFEFSEEIPKGVDNLVEENALSSENKVAETFDAKEKCTLKLSDTEDKSYASELKLETHSRNQKQKKDINGNEEPSSYENLNQLFDKLELSDSDNEENEDCSKLKERAPVKTQSRTKKYRDQNNVLSKNKSQDKSQFNPQTLKFLSGSSQIEFNEPNTADQVTIHQSLTSVLTGSEILPPPIQDYFYGDARAKAVSSPESGYESSSAQSGSSSPPLLPLSASYNLDFIPETVDEQNILEFLVENTTDCALTDHNLSVCNLDSKDAEGKIIEIINYLKDIPDELNESSNAAVPSDNIHEYVPILKNNQDLNTRTLPVSCNPVFKNAETPKKLVYKLNDKAKRTLREFLSVDEFYAAKARVYRRINDAANDEEIKVIYVEDETDRASENRTNLHHAVLDSRIEDIYCLVEIHKQYNKPLTDINIRDKYGKTALDYAIQNQMTLVVDYLKENTACQSVNI